MAESAAAGANGVFLNGEGIVGKGLLLTDSGAEGELLGELIRGVLFTVRGRSVELERSETLSVLGRTEEGCDKGRLSKVKCAGIGDFNRALLLPDPMAFGDV
jgi:hypothetical protein